jgi:poly(beta-D-mannuronate) lyase
MRTRRMTVILISLLAVLAAMRPAEARLRAPFDIAAIQAAEGKNLAAEPCPAPLPPVRDLIGTSFYTDPHFSRPDPSRLAADNAAEKPVRAYLAGVERSAMRWSGSQPPLPSAAACALTWLDAWASADAMLGHVNQQGSYEREWTLGGLALTWLAVRNAPGLDPAATSRVLQWFGTLATVVQPPYDRAPRPGLTTPRNNHAYWTGLAVAAAGIARDDRAEFDWGIQRLRYGIAQIDANGALPLELARARLALHYHLFALQPLAALDEMAYANGIDLEGDGQLAHLVATCFAGARDPALYARLSGTPQSGFSPGETKAPLREGAGFEIWLRRHPDPALSAALAPYRPFRSPWLGGDVSLLFGRPPAAR